MDNNKKIFYKGMILGILLFIWISLIYKESFYLFNRFINKEMSVNNKYNMIKKIVNKEYIGEYNEKELKDSMFMGMLYGVGDPYTSYISKNDFKNFTISTEGTYTGIGSTVMQAKDGGIIILSPGKRPAFLAGEPS